MRRKQKRLLQALGLALAALVFLPNVGLWSLARDQRPPHGAASPAQVSTGGLAPMETPIGWEQQPAEHPERGWQGVGAHPP